MSLVDYSEFINLVIKREFKEARSLGHLVDSIVEVVGKEDSPLFYPKNLFLDGKKVHAYVFKDDKVLSFEDSDRMVRISILPYRLITKIELLREKEDFPQLSLNISFSTGEEITLNGYNDTNSTWGEKFNEKIKEIIKLFK